MMASYSNLKCSHSVDIGSGKGYTFGYVGYENINVLNVLLSNGVNVGR